MTEELLAKGVAKLNKPTLSAGQRDETSARKGAKVASTTGDANLGAKEGTLRRVLLVRDRRTNESWRYGFAEYASIEDAQAALTRYNSFERFTIASKQVLVSYIHAGVFVPVLNPTSNTDRRFTFSPLGNPAMKLQYWDETAYVSELAVSIPEAKSSAAETTAPSLGKAARETATSTTEKAKKRKAAQAAEAETAVKKAAPSHLQFWSNRHAELHGIAPKSGDGGDDHKHNKHNKSSDTGGDDAAPPSQSYADPNRHCCYLCMRQFANNAEVNRHERLSDLHRQFLKDDIKVQKAQHKLAKHGIQPNQPVATATQYRDRARERRKVYGVVNKKGEQVQPPRPSIKPSRPAAGDDDEAAAPASAAAPKQSKGASLLSKMGYTAGQGLGASGEGITAPVSQDVYVAGVGLGAEGGKVGDAVVEAERNTKGGYDAFAERTREGARERYARLGQ